MIFIIIKITIIMVLCYNNNIISFFFHYLGQKRSIIQKTKQIQPLIFILNYAYSNYYLIKTYINYN